MAGLAKCDECGVEYPEGAWPYCPHGLPQGLHGTWQETWDEHIAPPPGPEFKPAPGVTLPEYVEGKGYNLKSRADRDKLLRLNGSYERGFRKHRGGGYR